MYRKPHFAETLVGAFIAFLLIGTLTFDVAFFIAFILSVLVVSIIVDFARDLTQLKA